ncbi:hypothetical protein GLYMA_09G121051v4 [Glycine max]|nr:hypothetical protein GLYMA_09G121051v4 [Glycine max]KAH1042677.1 hypothetical protein GYH30_024802 [Glycine max]
MRTLWRKRRREVFIVGHLPMALLKYSQFIGLRFCILSRSCCLKTCLSWPQLLRALTSFFAFCLLCMSSS